MNKKVFISMLCLCMIFLVAMYVLKIFFPQEFMFCIQNERLIKIGIYIDSHKWSYYLLGIFTSFITYGLYLCATCRKPFLGWKQIIAILITIGINIGLSFWDAQLAQHFSICSMLILPLIFKARLKEVCIVYTFHGLAQILSLSIRHLPMYIQYYNSLLFVLMTLECYLWLFLFYTIFNYKKKEA